MKLLVTGGAGYIGSTLVGLLLAEGHSVTVVDNFMWKQAPFNHLCMNPHLKIVNDDVRNWDVYKKYVMECDFIIPLAALVGFPLCEKDPLAAQSINCDAIETIARLAPKHVRFIMPVTNSGYGIGESGVHCTEETPMRPISVYGKTKVKAEKFLFDIRLDTMISLRLATVFGASPRMRLDLLVNDLVYRAVNDRAVTLFEPHFKRNYVHLRDVVKTFLFAIENFDKMRGKAFNVGLSDANLSKYELCHKIQKHLPKFVFNVAQIGEDPDKRDYIVSNARLESLGWYPHYSLDEGIQELIKCYQYLKRSEYGNV